MSIAKDLFKQREGFILPQTLSRCDSTGLVARWLLDGSLTDQVSGLVLTRAGTWNTTSYNMRWDTELSQMVPVFTGANYYTFSPTGFPSGAAVGTIMCWAKLRSTTSCCPFGYGVSGVRTKRALYHSTAWNFADGSITLLSGIDAMYDGTWHHIAATYNGTTEIIYIDGILQASATATLATDVSAGAIGTWLTTTYPMVGYVADCRCYSVALTAARVQAIAQGRA